MVVTKEYPPYNYQDSNGATVGLSTKVVEAVLEETQFSYDIELLPWARALQMAKDKENTLIFTLAINAERQKEFKFVAKIAPDVRRCFFKLPSRADIAIQSLNDIKAYDVGTVIESSMEQDLLNAGFETNVNIHPNTRESPIKPGQ